MLVNMESFWHVVTNDSKYCYYYGFVYHVLLHSLLASKGKGKAVFKYYHLSPVHGHSYIF